MKLPQHFLWFRYAITAFVLLMGSGVVAAEKTSVLIIDGRNNHDWRTTTESLQATLNRTGLFAVEVTTAPEEKIMSAPKEPKGGDPAFAEARGRYELLRKTQQAGAEAEWGRWLPDFSNYAAVILNYNGPEWPAPMKKAFVEYVQGGGGVFLIHAANNGFSNWPEFNEMIGLGWRKGGFGVCLTIDPATGKPVECCADAASSHGSRHAFVITNRQPEHPVLRGVPMEWWHGKDELYHHMRGPAKGVTILASAFSDAQKNGTGLHEPVLWETAFGKGRVLTCSLGHFWSGQTDWDALYCAGFQTLLARGMQYVASGKVTLDLPAGFMAKGEPSIVPPHRLVWTAGGKSTEAVVPAEPDWKAKKAANEMAVLTPEEEKATFVLPEGFEAQLVAAEPMVEEPVLAVWDGDAAMYVAEMRSYMQDEKGTDTKTARNGRIKRLLDTDGDGCMDKVTVFVDGLNLPRMALPLSDGIAVVETDSTSVWSYRDTDHDGVADEKKLLFQGKNGDPNHSVEHQDSGLDWNLDNWIYVSYGRERYRFTDGTWKAEPMHGIWAQWGLTHDDTGRVFYSDNSTPAAGFELGRSYWNLIKSRSGESLRSGDPISLGLPWDMSFLASKNLCQRDDRGGVAGPRKTFTSACGQSVYRGNALPLEMRGDYFFCDPTIHVVRRAKLEDRNGKTFFINPYDQEEFLLSSDILFRPVNTATAPDGSLIVVDMYRGIIQDAPWLSEGPRKFIKDSGLAAVNRHGRIWRIKHRDHTTTAAPAMLHESTTSLLRHLEHPNGWWRDTAQRLIILRPDRDTVAPLLADMVRFNDKPLARLHALWALEGMCSPEVALLQTAYRDQDPTVRAAAIQISEPYIAKSESGILEALDELSKKEASGNVAKQIILSLGYCKDDRVIPMMDRLIQRHLKHEGVFLAACTVLWKRPSPYLLTIQSGEAFKAIKDPGDRAMIAARWTQGLAQWNRGLKLPKDMPKERQQLISKGEDIYYQTCVSCHGPDGKGVSVPGSDMAIAPALAGSLRVKGATEGMVPLFVNGLLGPIEGKTYQGAFMTPAIALGITRDDRLAEVISFIRYAWGNEASSVTKDEVGKFRKAHANRSAPWTDEELKKQIAPPESTGKP